MRTNQRCYADIDLRAIGHNIDQVKGKIPEGVKVMAVIKADAYGHGAVQVGKYLENQVDYDAIPADLLKDSRSVLSALDNRGVLSLGTLKLRCLIIPACRRLPLPALGTLAGLAREGFPVIFTDSLPEGSCEGQDASRPLALLQKYAFCTRLSSLKQLLKLIRFI